MKSKKKNAKIITAATKNIATAPATVEQYLQSAPPEARAALEMVRKTIRATAPTVSETIQYGVPTYKAGKSPLVSFAFTPRHCAFYVMSAGVMASFARDLAQFDTAPTAIRFKPEAPIPISLVRAIVKARLAEID
jgi:uncharacterized protein YdhG (YjbR/CyaY superfamily)